MWWSTVMSVSSLFYIILIFSAFIKLLQCQLGSFNFRLHVFFPTLGSCCFGNMKRHGLSCFLRVTIRESKSGSLELTGISNSLIVCTFLEVGVTIMRSIYISIIRLWDLFLVWIYRLMLLNKDFIWRAFYVHPLCPLLLFPVLYWISHSWAYLTKAAIYFPLFKFTLAPDFSVFCFSL